MVGLVVDEGVPAIGAALVGLMATVTGTMAVPPLPSETVTVKESVFSAVVAPFFAAACRAVAVGV